jgi:DNA-directed RNA polymerase subunit N (RpoN/RPB10)
MYPLVLCYCGRSLADIYDLFLIMRAARIAETYAMLDEDIDPEIFPIAESMQPSLTDIFEQLNIHLICCRNHLQTQVEFKTVY